FAGVTTLLLVVDRPVLLPVLWLAGGLTIGALFVVGHDAAHGPLFRSHRLAYWTAQLPLLPGFHPHQLSAPAPNPLHHAPPPGAPGCASSALRCPPSRSAGSAHSAGCSIASSGRLGARASTTCASCGGSA